MRLADATWPEVEGRTSGTPTVLVLPVGALEQHGPHLPLDTDATTATAVAEGVVAARPGAVLAPTLPYGASDEHADFPGTISIGTEALRDVLVAIVRGSATTFDAVLAINGHGGNAAGIRAAIETCASEGRVLARHHLGLAGMDARAGRSETSLLLHLTPERVRTELAETGNTTPIREIIEEMRARGVRALSPNGVLGDPTDATAEHGTEMRAALVELALDAYDDVARSVA
ncbi:mycofactocin biosynthesis peptidyl-dipeptidase MftE [Georgenia sp. Z1491]|uniref:mycofactocin biosynthesis peptidyl-dipeptidase MftE n=1 Tax=Georgenia sp. Z1491 TaxID=3416707 RepID=UPI003CE76464